MEYIFMNGYAVNNTERNPLVDLHNKIACSSKDYSLTEEDRMIYAIVCGWHDDDDKWDDDICCNQFGWSKEKSNFMKILHEEFKKYEQIEI